MSLHALPPGADFAAAFAAGLLARYRGQPPEALAAVTIHVNAVRTLNAIRAALEASGPLLLPRLRLIAELGDGPVASPLSRRLELGRLIAGLVEAQPTLAGGQAAPALAESLAALMAEMQSEGCAADALARLDVGDHARHWQLSQAFLGIAAQFYLGGEAVDREARQRAAAEAAAADWAAGRNLPAGPVIVAGSTGSHGATRLFMQAVARLPQGAVVLPGYDFDAGPLTEGDDHPQARFAPLVAEFGAPAPWHDAPAPDPARNRLISLALRPAPVTDQWIAEGPSLGDLGPPTAALTLIEAPDPQAEAEAIAVAIRQSVEAGRRITLIAADRLLTRRVAAALDRWGLVADDSAGQPLPLTAPGLFLRQVAALFGRPLTLDVLIALLKSPMAAGGAAHGPHLLWTRRLELHLRRHGPAFPDGAALRGWAADQGPQAVAWADWLAPLVDRMRGLEGDHPARPLPDRLQDHRGLAEAVAAGPEGWAEGGAGPDADGDADAGGTVETGAGHAAGEPPAAAPDPASDLLHPASPPDGPPDAADPAPLSLWQRQEGALARAVMDNLAAEALPSHRLGARDYAALIDAELQSQALRTSDAHPLIRIRGPREARTEAVGRVILGGLNEGSWPQALPADPWLSRPMRREAGLTLPERRIGLAAHDFQQALAAEEVILSRARRDSEAETVPSRWLNRLTNLMTGLPDQRGGEALKAMQARGDVLLGWARALGRPEARVPPAPRPAPLPPGQAFRQLSVTRVSTLIRDPYAIYARAVLGLAPLPALHPQADAALRGEVFHRIVERFLTPAPAPGTPPQVMAKRFLTIAETVIADEVPWPAARAFWLHRLSGAVSQLMADEARRLAAGQPVVIEGEVRFPVPGLSLTLIARPDRIDALTGGGAHIYDYKSGAAPTERQIEAYDKQLPLTAALLARGAFPETGATEVAGLSYIQLRSDGKTIDRPMSAADIEDVWARFVTLAGRYLAGEVGFTARRSMADYRFGSEYDHLSRHGEWSVETPPTTIIIRGDRP